MPNSSALTSERQRLAGWLWLAVVLLMLAVLGLKLPGARLNSSVLALLPGVGGKEVPAPLRHGFMQRLDGQLMWLVAVPEEENDAAARWWLTRLTQEPWLKSIQGPMSDAQQKEWGRFAWQHRAALIDPATRTRLGQGGEAQASWILAQLYSAFSGVSGAELRGDPLMLVRGAQLAQQQGAGALRLHNGWLTAVDGQGQRWYLIHGELKGDAFSMRQGNAAVDRLTVLSQQLHQRWPQAQLLSRGALFYSDHASRQAHHEMSTLGVGTLCGVLLLVFAVFRSPRPLLLCLLSVAIGALAGVTVTLLWYGELHLMTLVMSMGIIGVSADYTLYYLTERMVHGAKDSALASLVKVRATLLLALGTTLLAWGVMMMAPFPGIRQMALFAASGLSASCLTVICWYPQLAKGLPVRPVPLRGLMVWWLAAWRRPGLRLGLPLLVALFSAVGLWQLRVDDDISRLQAMPPELVAQDRAIGQLTGQSLDQRWFMVWGDSPQQALERLEALTPRLEQARNNGWLTGWRQLPLSSLARQKADMALLGRAAHGVEQRLAAAGLNIKVAVPEERSLTPEQWLNSVNSSGWRLLWLSLADGRSGILVPVDGVTQSAALGRLAQESHGVAWVDRKAEFDGLFGFWRGLLSGLLALALLVIGVSYVVRLGLRHGLQSVAPSLLALLGGLATLGLCGQPLNLFALLALTLVLGIGINYTLFFSNPRGTPLTSLLAVSVALATTLLTLGMLVFSQTGAISGFGTVLASGIFIAWLTAPLALSDRKENHE
jgi:predicted exporter